MRRLCLLAVLSLLAACGGSAPSPSDKPSSPLVSPIVSPTSKGTPNAPPTGASPPSVTAPAFLASTVNGLRLRAGPGLAEAALTFPCNPVEGCSDNVVLNAGERGLALAGPVAAEGYDWYLLRPDQGLPGSGYLGWAATPHAGDPWLVAAAYDCPAGALDLDRAISMGNVGVLYCYGNHELEFDGHVVVGFGCNSLGTFEPWLAHPCGFSVISPNTSTDGGGALFWHYPAPGVTNPTVDLDPGQLVRIVGHFDDPAAATCTMQYEGADRVDPASAIAQCRLRFVVTEVITNP